MKNAQIPQFMTDRVPKLEKHIDCNDNLTLWAFQKRKYIRAWLQKKGAAPLIENHQNYVDHILKATQALFPLRMDMPLPEKKLLTPYISYHMLILRR